MKGSNFFKIHTGVNSSDTGVEKLLLHNLIIYIQGAGFIILYFDNDFRQYRPAIEAGIHAGKG
jgi:hypothetical protein